MVAVVPRLAEGRTVVCLGTGPSLTQADVDRCRGQIVICVNDAYRLAPWADCLMASDAAWWKVHKGVPSFTGLKYSLEPHAAKWATVLRNTGTLGIETDPTALRTGRNSGYAALNLAVHLGAPRILLLGYDMRYQHGKTHFFGDHPAPLGNRSEFPKFIEAFMSTVKPLQALGVSMINCTPVSALACFPKMLLAEALAAQPQEAVA